MTMNLFNEIWWSQNCIYNDIYFKIMKQIILIKYNNFSRNLACSIILLELNKSNSYNLCQKKGDKKLILTSLSKWIWNFQINIPESDAFMPLLMSMMRSINSMHLSLRGWYNAPQAMQAYFLSWKRKKLIIHVASNKWRNQVERLSRSSIHLIL